MRLLTHDCNGKLVLQTFDSDALPAYAILSHTWHVDNSQEVSFQDFEANEGKSKAGYAKIRFCEKQAAADGLRYFWIDTCCINKRNDPELSEAINSMFRWYEQATRCYVYLSDVSTQSCNVEGSSKSVWEPAVRKSRWFTRGWTLQELIAPRVVEFYTSDGEKLGDKSSLETSIFKVTGIAREALRGGRLTDFGIEEKMSWAANRSTKRVEDSIYSLLGLFGIFMPLVYGEGRENALRRLRREMDETFAAPGPDQYIVGLSLARIPGAAKFVAREKELHDMHRLLYCEESRSVVVLHGLGGIGKTQLAVAYTRRHKTQYSAVFWIDAISYSSIGLCFVEIAQQILLQHPSTSVFANVDLENDPSRTVEAVISWLSSAKNTRWLLIYDNYDNPRIPGHVRPDTVDLRRYIPQCDHGSIVITTRSALVTLGSRVHVKKLSNIEEGLAILSHTSGRECIEDDPAAISLAKELDGLPLALSTAGAYLEQVTTTFSEYQRMYETSWLQLQRLSPQISSYEDRSLYTTWQLSLDQIQQRNESAAKLLKLWAYFDRQDVWYELLQCGRPCEWLERVTGDRATFDHTMRLLCSYGLVDPETSERKVGGLTGYSMHSCVHAWTIFVINKDWDGELARLTLSCVASMVPDRNAQEWWVTQSKLLQHVTRCASVIIDRGLDTTGMEWALNRLGNLYMDQGKLSEAEAMYLRALQGKEEALGPKHTSTLNTLNDLGVLYRDQAKLNEAETVYVRALQGREEALGLKHMSTLNTVNNLGSLYLDQGKLIEAEAMYLRALQGKEEVLGPKHTSTLDTVNNLGILYAHQGKLKEAEAMYLRALQGTEEVLGPKHTSTLETVNNLGILYADQGKLNEAEAVFIRALQGREEVLGPKHVLTLQTVKNLGVLYMKQGKLKEAEVMLLRALQGKEEALGPKHTSTLDTVNSLGILYAHQGKLKEAEVMLLRALQGKEEVLGPKHTSILDTVNNLGILYMKQGKLKEAEVMYIRALQGYEDALGGDRMNSYLPALNAVRSMGDIYAELGSKQKAMAMYSTALSGFAAVHGRSSNTCQHIERRLKALSLLTDDMETRADTDTGFQPEISNSRLMS